MKIVNVRKAQPIGDQVIHDVEINIGLGAPIDTKDMSLDDLKKYYHDEASAIFRALRSSLPGGVFDQLAGLMLQEKASHLIVSHER